MEISFSDLVKIYRKAIFNGETGFADYSIDTEESLELLKNLTSDEAFEKSSIELTEGTLNLNNNVKLLIRKPDGKVGNFYFNFLEMLKGDFSRTIRDKFSSLSHKIYIVNINYYSEDNEQPKEINNYILVKELFINLKKMAVYNAAENNQLIFFGKKRFELDYDVQPLISEFEKALVNFNDIKISTIQNFNKWLDDKDTSKHLDEKKSILAAVLEEQFKINEFLNVVDVIDNIESIDTSVRSQYNLYLEDFKYEKFVKKLEENSEKFVSRINDSISKVLSQVLALPIAVAVPTILKNTQPSSPQNFDMFGMLIVYFSLLAYTIVCYVALQSQKTVLENIDNEVENFESRGKIPNALQSQWKDDKDKIILLIQSQRYLYWTLMIVVGCAFILSIIKILETIF